MPFAFFLFYFNLPSQNGNAFYFILSDYCSNQSYIQFKKEMKNLLRLRYYALVGSSRGY